MPKRRVAGDDERPVLDHRREIAERNVLTILDAADRLLDRRSQASIAAVAVEAGLSRVTVYAHFRTRDKLLEAVVERAVQRTMSLFDDAHLDEHPALDALERLISLAWQELDTHHGRVQAALQQLSPTALTRSHEAALHRLGNLVERGRRDGTIRRDLPTAWLVAAFIALMHASAEQVNAGQADPSSALALLSSTIRELFAGTR
jgi:TetR/AcrR family transcriptional regulator, mexCD-oprJ operon repressor